MAPVLPSLSPNDKLLAARISLPESPWVACAIHRGSYDAIESARRIVLASNSDNTLASSVLVGVETSTEPLLYLFLIAGQEALGTAYERLLHFSFDHLTFVENASFAIQDLSSAAHQVSLTRVYSYFLDAVRSAVIADIVATANRPALSTNSQVQRFKDGFLISRAPSIPDWAAGWEHKVLHRPMVYFHLQIQLACVGGDSPTHLVVHPSPLPTSFTGLPSDAAISPGTPIVLLPYGIPAYFLAAYKGPSHALSKLFKESLQGLGAGQWYEPQGSTFLIGWIKVENKQGEEKGTPFIWPTRLCLSYLPSHNARPLDPLPELPAALQASPSPAQPILSSDTPLGSFPKTLRPPTSPSSNAFRSLTLPKAKGLHHLVDEVGSYVDAVARDRERERERLKKEREAGASPKLARKVVTNNATSIVQGSIRGPATSTLPAPPTNTPAQQALADQVYYPSPPQTSQIPAPPSMATPPPPRPVEQVTQPPGTPYPPPTPASMNSLEASQTDPFAGGNAGWNHQSSSDNYMNLDMDFNMEVGDLNFNVPMDASNDQTSNAYTNIGSSLDFEDFEDLTEDDFSFFDNPSKSKPKPSVPTTHPHGYNNAFVSPSPIKPFPPAKLALQVEDMHLSGPGPPTALHTPWTPGGLFTPRSTMDGLDSQPPDLVPTSPGTSPESPAAPLTPPIQLNFDFALPVRRIDGGYTAHASSSSSHLFEAIPFSMNHKTADSKYFSGKFALIDRSSSSSPLSTENSADPPWRKRYDSVTDPRIGVVRKLIGVKRKLPSRGDGTHLNKSRAATLAWLHHRNNSDDWITPSSPSNYQEENADSDSDDEQMESDTESPAFSRPATPPPSYLPPGPSLLHCHFEHSQLLPISMSAKTQGSTSHGSSIPQTPGPMLSVPTPVSPAAMVGAVSSRSKAVRKLAAAAAIESVENPLWAETWRALNPAHHQQRLESARLEELQTSATLIHHSRSLDGPLDLAGLYDLDSEAKSLPTFQKPQLAVGKGHAIIDADPSALRFWDKLGLGPRGGMRDLEAYALFEEGDSQRQGLVDDWMASAAAAYKAKYLGRMALGSTQPMTNGSAPVRYDATLFNNLSTLLSSLPGSDIPIVIFVIIPESMMALSSTPLRQLFGAITRAKIGFTSRQLVFHLVPQRVVSDIEESHRRYSILDTLCYSLYDRVRVTIPRRVSPSMPTIGLRHQHFQEFAYTVARPLVPKVVYTRETHPSLDVLDRFTLLHVGYKLSPCQKWVLVSVIDQRGECFEQELFFIPQDDPEVEGELGQAAYIAHHVLDFAFKVARRTDIEWRIVITKLGLMTPSELDAWQDKVQQEAEQKAQMHIFVTAAEYETAWAIIEPKYRSPTSPSRTSKIPSSAKQIYTDCSSTVYAIHPASRLSIASRPPVCPRSRLSDVTAPHAPIMPHPLPALPQATTVLLSAHSHFPDKPVDMLHIHLLYSFHSHSTTSSVPDDTTTHLDLTQNFFELAVLASARRVTCALSPANLLPLHLIAVESMCNCLDIDWEAMERAHEA
ncbi:mediator complex subunit 13 C-terminal-domain-containing protein [Coprinopsis sp. MPI-PUGE-AT-0042]|nr:mediator complex subunit 13 C-terminal-domain-containing protein [Coprinopsis sp. MPI-PUGE-AT-0042]